MRCMCRFCFIPVFLLTICLLYGCGDPFEPSEVIIAEIENFYTKTRYDGDGFIQKIKWELGDTIRVNDQLFVARELADGDKKAYFHPVDGGKIKINSPFVAVYPHTLIDGDEITIPKSRILSLEEVGRFYSPMYAKGENLRLLFRNICGVIALSIKGNERITSVRLSSTSGALSGVVDIEGESKSIPMDMSNSPVEITFDKPVSLSKEGVMFYFAVPPFNYNNIKVFITADNGTTSCMNILQNTAVERNSVTSLDISPEFESNPFLESPSPAKAFTCAVINGKKKMISFSSGKLYYIAQVFPKTYTMKMIHLGMQKKQVYLEGNYDYVEFPVGNERCIRNTLFPWHAFNVGDKISEMDFSVFNDAGQFFDDGNTWFTLSAEEWDFLLNDPRRGSRIGDTNNSRFFKIQIRKDDPYFTNHRTAASGIAILPDNFIWPSDIPQPKEINNPSVPFITNVYTLEEWSILEDNGVIILDCSFDEPVDLLQPEMHNGWGNYWSSTGYNEGYAYDLFISKWSVNPYHISRKLDYTNFLYEKNCPLAIDRNSTYPMLILTKLFQE